MLNYIPILYAGFSGLQNGKLLSAIDKVYDAFITIDSNLKYQQNFSDKTLRVIVLRAPSNRLEDILPLLPQVYDALQSMDEGEIRSIY